MTATSGEHVEHLYTLICGHAQAVPGGPTNLLGMMDMIAVADLPSEPSVLPVNFVVVAGWRRNRDPGIKFRQRFALEHESGQQDVVSPEYELDLTHLHLTSVFLQVLGLPLRGYGQYFFVAQREIDGKWIDALPSAGLWIARPDWKEHLDPANPLYAASKK